MENSDFDDMFGDPMSLMSLGNLGNLALRDGLVSPHGMFIRKHLPAINWGTFIDGNIKHKLSLLFFSIKTNDTFYPYGDGHFLSALTEITIIGTPSE